MEHRLKFSLQLNTKYCYSYTLSESSYGTAENKIRHAPLKQQNKADGNLLLNRMQIVLSWGISFTYEIEVINREVGVLEDQLRQIQTNQIPHRNEDRIREVVM